MSLCIQMSGLLDTIQDGGRYGHQQSGINPGGAMDRIAMRIANILVGNDPEEAVIELHFPAAEILFEENVLIAMAGADFSAKINGKEISLLHPVLIKKNAVLNFTKKQKGARAYLAAQSGFVTERWLGSSSTNLKVNAGGFEGRELQKNDQLFIKQKRENVLSKTGSLFEVFPWQAKTTDLYVTDNIRFIPGAEYGLLKDVSKKELQDAVFTITRNSDRMGYHLQGETLQLETHTELISTAVTRGTIQLLPDGQLIVLMADHQTTGGYPRIGHVISTDICSLSQMEAGKKFSFRQVNINTAERFLLEQEMNLQQLQNACNFRLQQHFVVT